MKLLHLKDKKFSFFQQLIKRKNLNTCALVMGGIFQKQKYRDGNEISYCLKTLEIYRNKMRNKNGKLFRFV